MGLLAGVANIDNVSQALGQASRQAAAMSLDAKFVRSHARVGIMRGVGAGAGGGMAGSPSSGASGSLPATAGSSEKVGSLGSGLLDGTEMLAKGVLRGVTGILTKPVEGAMEGGARGFVEGVGRGVLGAATQPVSGVLGLASRTVAGVAASYGQMSDMLSKRGGPQRVRLPRAVAPGGALRPFDARSARGQHLLHTAQRGAYLGAADPFFQRRGRYRVDAYVAHEDLPGSHVAVLSDRRCVYLRHGKAVQVDIRLTLG